MKHYINTPGNGLFRYVLALILTSSLVLTVLPPRTAGQQVRLGAAEARSLLLLVREAANLAANPDIRHELQLVQKTLEDANSNAAGGEEVQVISFSRVRDMLRNIIDEPRGESKELLEKVAKGLELLDRLSTQEFRGGVRPRMETAFGLHTATFDTLQGTVTVNLPDDMAAGDVISGTVIAEPKGKDAAEQAKNRDELNGYVVELEKQEAKPSEQPAKWLIPAAATTARLILRSKGGKELAHLPIALDKHSGGANLGDKNKFPGIGSGSGRPQPSDISKRESTSTPAGSPSSWTGPVIQTSTVQQAGRPIEIKGAFDGDAQSTGVMIGGRAVQLLAESPRKVVAKGVETLGLSEIEVDEQGKTIAKGSFVNVGVRLSAGKLSLLRGEQTTMTLTVLGLDRLQTPMSLQLTNSTPSVVQLAGGNKQLLSIDPKQVQGGSFTTTRGLTGVQPGGFVINATVVTTENQLQPVIEAARRQRPEEAMPRAQPCDAFSRKLQEVAEDTRFEIELDNPTPQPVQVFTARLVPASSDVRLVGDELSISQPGGLGLNARMEVRWRLNGREGDLGPADLLTPDGPQSLRSNPLRLALAPDLVVEAGTSPIPTSSVTLYAYIRLHASCGGRTIGVSRGEETLILSDEIRVPPREIQLPALQIPTLLALFRNPSFHSRLWSETTWFWIEGAALIVWYPGLRAGPLEANTLLGTVDPNSNLSRAPELVIQYLTGLDERLLALSTTFPTNPVVQGLGVYRTSLAQMKEALQFMTYYTRQRHISFRATNELRQLNFPFIEGSHVLNNVNVEDEVSSLILAGAPGKTLEIFNAPNLEEGEGVLSITTDYPGFSAVIPNLNVFTRSWARAFPEGDVIDGGARVRVLRPPAGNVLRPLVGNFEDQISSLRVR